MTSGIWAIIVRAMWLADTPVVALVACHCRLTSSTTASCSGLRCTSQPLARVLALSFAVDTIRVASFAASLDGDPAVVVRRAEWVVDFFIVVRWGNEVGLL